MRLVYSENRVFLTVKNEYCAKFRCIHRIKKDFCHGVWWLWSLCIAKWGFKKKIAASGYLPNSSWRNFTRKLQQDGFHLVAV